MGGRYNLSAASIALPFMQAHPFFAAPEWVHYTGLGVVFVGAVLGMLCMGYLGDLLGRRRAMLVTLAIQALGAVGCSLVTWGDAQDIYIVFCASRLLLGIGVGGMYPLSASHSAESSSKAESAANRVGWAFFWQTPGAMAPYVVAVVLLLVVGDKQCSYFEDQAKCQGASLVSLPAPLADAAPVGNKYCCGYAVAGSCSGSHDVTKLTVDFKSLTAIDIQVTIDGTDSNCPAEAIAYNHTSGAVTFPGITGPNDCLGKIDGGNGIDTPVVAYDHTQDVVTVQVQSTSLELKKGSCQAGPSPSPPPSPTPTPTPPAQNSSCVWNASGNGVCSFTASAPRTIPSVEYRLITGLGIIPPLIVMAAVARTQDSAEFSSVKAASPWAEVQANPRYWKTLIGTGGTWFLYDISYYGTAIFQPSILKSIFGQGETLFAISWQSLVIAAVGLPGVVAAIFCMHRFGNKWLNIWGFLLVAALFAAMAITYHVDPDASNLLFIEFMALTFALNFGPNVATYVLPAMAFPPQVRGTFHGLSAGSGKVGAVVGTFIYAPISDSFGVATVMW